MTAAVRPTPEDPHQRNLYQLCIDLENIAIYTIHCSIVGWWYDSMVGWWYDSMVGWWYDSLLAARRSM